MNAIDIVIPSAGRPELLVALLDSLARHPPPPGLALTVTVSDDRHAAQTAQRVGAAHPAVRYVAGPARGPAANRNHGAALGHAPWLLFLDDDCRLDSDLLSRYCEHAQADPDARVLEGAILAAGARPSALHHAPINSDGGWLWSCNFMIERRLFERLGGFDERFPYALEDCDFMQRLRDLRVRVPFVPAALVRHPWRQVTRAEIARQMVGHAVMADKHAGFARGWTLVHLLRALRARVRQYTSAQRGPLTLRMLPTAACDFLAPVAMWAVVRIAPLRRAVVRRARAGLPGRAAGDLCALPYGGPP